MTSPRTTIFPFCSGLALTFFVHAATAAGPKPGTAYYVLDDFPVQTATESDFRTEYWGRSVGNATDSCPECKVSLTSTKEASGDFARLTYSLPKKGNGTYFAMAGILLPLDNVWSSSNDLRMSSRLMFKARTSSTFPYGVNLDVSVESPVFPFQTAGYSRVKVVVVTEGWEWYSIGYNEFAYASWMKNDALAGTKNVVVSDGIPADTSVLRSVRLNPRAIGGKLLNIDSATSPDYDNDSVNALKSVQALRFEIDPIYGSGGIELDSEYAAASQNVSLDIDSITLVGIHGEVHAISRRGNKCTATPLVLDDFDLADPAKVAGVRHFGGRSLAGGCESVNAWQGASRQILATYHKGLHLGYSLPGVARIDILRMDGSLVASHTRAASGQNLSVPVKLNRGTYLVVVRGGGQVRSAKVSVVGP